MIGSTDPAKRGAAVPDGPHEGSVSLLNSFVVDPGRDEAFQQLWSRTSEYFRGQPGFVGLRLHRALSPDATYRYVNVAVWASAAQFQAAHVKPEFRAVVSQPGWAEFPSSPALYEVVTEYAAAPVG